MAKRNLFDVFPFYKQFELNEHEDNTRMWDLDSPKESLSLTRESLDDHSPTLSFKLKIGQDSYDFLGEGHSTLASAECHYRGLDMNQINAFAASDSSGFYQLRLYVPPTSRDPPTVLLYYDGEVVGMYLVET
eukprot:TRINITY_DN8073_c0_g1_i1.p1 TRINITY_DN8073_c0_g1~~TRINITY_DN8073_c0_g1_i1.p1  ORF type:complete len:132 (+),score=21.79 TRINITY_DN8073_c0_g1_i1:167-562(+)